MTVMVWEPTLWLLMACDAVATPPAKNRRRRPRQPCSLFAEVRLLTGRKDITRPAEVCDISGQGCRIRVGRAYQPGALLNVKIFDQTTEKRSVVRVGSVSRAAGGPDGGGVLGVDFATPLAKAQVAGLLSGR